MVQAMCETLDNEPTIGRNHTRKSHYSEEQIIGILRLAEAGQTVVEVCRQHGASESTYYRWNAQYGGLEVSQLRRLRQLEEENRKLKPKDRPGRWAVTLWVTEP